MRYLEELRSILIDVGGRIKAALISERLPLITWGPDVGNQGPCQDQETRSGSGSDQSQESDECSVASPDLGDNFTRVARIM